jgi:TatD DNase family protein
MVKDFVDLGVYFSISGYFFREGKEEKLRVFDLVPQDRILLETDAPDMMPPGEFVRCSLTDDAGDPINHPVNLVSIYDALAKRRGITVGETVTCMRENFASWYFRGSRAGSLSLFPPISAL